MLYPYQLQNNDKNKYFLTSTTTKHLHILPTGHRQIATIEQHHQDSSPKGVEWRGWEINATNHRLVGFIHASYFNFFFFLPQHNRASSRPRRHQSIDDDESVGGCWNNPGFFIKSSIHHS